MIALRKELLQPALSGYTLFILNIPVKVEIVNRKHFIQTHLLVTNFQRKIESIHGE